MFYFAAKLLALFRQPASIYWAQNEVLGVMLMMLFANVALLMGCAVQVSPTAIATPTPAKPQIKLTLGSVGQTPVFDKITLEASAGSQIVLEFNNNTPRGERIMQNWVLVQPGAEESLLADAASQTLADSFIKPNDPRVIAFTTAIVGSQAAIVTFDAPPPGRYTYLSTTPRHAAMRGVLVIK